jgi:hypothetical protein
MAGTNLNFSAGGQHLTRPWPCCPLTLNVGRLKTVCIHVRSLHREHLSQGTALSMGQHHVGGMKHACGILAQVHRLRSIADASAIHQPAATGVRHVQAAMAAGPLVAHLVQHQSSGDQGLRLRPPVLHTQCAPPWQSPQWKKKQGRGDVS